MASLSDRAELLLRRSRLRNESGCTENPYRVVRLCVGDQHFHTTRSTLSVVSNTVLALLVESEWSSEIARRDPHSVEEVVFIDRNPRPFSLIMRFLRHCADARDSGAADAEGVGEKQLSEYTLSYLSIEDINELIVEANYFGMTRFEAFLRVYVTRKWIENGHFSEIDKHVVVHGGIVLSLDFDDASDTIVAGLSDGSIAVYWMLSLEQQALLARGVHSDYVTCVRVSPSLIVGGSRDKTISVWCNGLGMPDDRFPLLAQLRGHTDFVQTLFLYDEGRALVSGSYDQTIRLWSLSGYIDTAAELARKSTGSIDGLAGKCDVIDCLFGNGPQHTLIVSGGVRLAAELWGRYAIVASGKCVDVVDFQKLTVHQRAGPDHKTHIRSLAVDQASALAVTGSWDGEVRLWKILCEPPPSASRAAQKRGSRVELVGMDDMIADDMLHDEDAFHFNNRVFQKLQLVKVIAVCEGWVSHLAFVGSLVAVGCGTSIRFLSIHARPTTKCTSHAIHKRGASQLSLEEGDGANVVVTVVRRIDTQHVDTLRTFVCLPERNCIITGSFDGCVAYHANTALHACARRSSTQHTREASSYESEFSCAQSLF